MDAGDHRPHGNAEVDQRRFRELQRGFERLRHRIGRAGLVKLGGMRRVSCPRDDREVGKGLPEPLCKALYDGDWQVREVAVEALGQIGSPAVEMLIKMVRDWDVRKYVIMALGKIRDERVLDPLMVQLRSDEFKDDATNALVELGEPALERLVKALKDKDEMVRKQAVLALGRIKHGGAVDPLIEMLADADWFTRLTAAASLEAIGDPRGRDAIKPLTKDPDMVVRMRVERILAKWKKQPAGSVSMN